MNPKKKIRSVVKSVLATFLRKTGVVDARLEKGGVIILMFHKVNDDFDHLPLTIPPAIFEQILAELSKKHEIVSLESLIDQNGELIVDDTIKFAITFDDGYRDNYEQAYPILKNHNLPATIYLSYGHLEKDIYFWYEQLISGISKTNQQVVNLVDLGSEKFSLESMEERNFAITTLNLWLKQFTHYERVKTLHTILARLKVEVEDLEVSSMLSWNMVNEMSENKICFGSHTVNHPILSKENDKVVESEIVGSRKLLIDKTKLKMEGFAYPNGTSEDYDERSLKYVSEAGYQHACTTISGINYAGQDPYQLMRMNIDLGMCTDSKGKFYADLFWAKLVKVI